MCGIDRADQQRRADRIQLQQFEFEHVVGRQLFLDGQFVVQYQFEFIERQLEFIVWRWFQFVGRLEFVVKLGEQQCVLVFVVVLLVILLVFRRIVFEQLRVVVEWLVVGQLVGRRILVKQDRFVQPAAVNTGGRRDYR